MNQEEDGSPPKGGRVLGWVLALALLGGLALALHLSVGWRGLLRPWGEIPPGSLTAAVALVLVSYAIRTVRVHRYFLPDTSGAFPVSFRLILVHNLFNNLLPMRSGEASFPILMKREFGVSYSRSIPGLFFLRVLDLHFLVLLVLGVLLVDVGVVGWAFTLALAGIPFLGFRLRAGLQPRLEEGRGWLSRILARVLSGIPSSLALFSTTYLWTAVNWTAKLLVFAWILRTFVPMPFGTALMGSVTGEVSSVLPFHGLAGAGTYEAGILAGLMPLGISLEEGLRGGVNLHLFVLGVSIVSGGIALALSPLMSLRETPGS